MPATESNWNSNRNRRTENHSVMGERKSPPFLFGSFPNREKEPLRIQIRQELLLPEVALVTTQKRP
jgi:hypothetical protein